MNLEEELSQLVQRAKQLGKNLAETNCPEELRLPILITLLLRSSGLISTDQVSRGRLTIDEFFDQFKATNKGEFVLAAAYYLYTIQSKGEFTGADLVSVLKQARIPDIPSNIADVLNKLAQRKKWFIEVKTKGQQKVWTLSREGERTAATRMQGGKDD